MPVDVKQLQAQLEASLLEVDRLQKAYQNESRTAEAAYVRISQIRKMLDDATAVLQRPGHLPPVVAAELETTCDVAFSETRYWLEVFRDASVRLRNARENMLSSARVGDQVQDQMRPHLAELLRIQQEKAAGSVGPGKGPSIDLSS